jgi:hypothetical protein
MEEKQLPSSKWLMNATVGWTTDPVTKKKDRPEDQDCEWMNASVPLEKKKPLYCIQ